MYDIRYYMYNDDEECYWIDIVDYQSMDNGIRVPHYRPEPEKMVSYHNFAPLSNDVVEMFKASDKTKKIMWVADGKTKKPSDGDICPICNRKIKIVKVKERN